MTLTDFGKQLSENMFAIDRSKIIDACKAAQLMGYEHLTLITVVDWKTSWGVVYHLTKFGEKNVLTFKVTLPYQDPTIASVTALWPGAGWHERECYDLMGIAFIGNHDLRRILLPQNFDGHPLRKEVKYGNTS